MPRTPAGRQRRLTHTALCWRVQDGKTISPWHEIPLEAGDGMYNFVCEIPKMTLKKMEVRPARPCTTAAGTLGCQARVPPVCRLRPRSRATRSCRNYGCLPQTWEDPNVKGDADVGGAFGDDDPVDVVEIGAASQEMGAVVPVKPLGVLSMIDDGEVGTLPLRAHLHKRTTHGQRATVTVAHNPATRCPSPGRRRQPSPRAHAPGTLLGSSTGR